MKKNITLFLLVCLLYTLVFDSYFQVRSILVINYLILHWKISLTLLLSFGATFFLIQDIGEYGTRETTFTDGAFFGVPIMIAMLTATITAVCWGFRGGDGIYLVGIVMVGIMTIMALFGFIGEPKLIDALLATASLFYVSIISAGFGICISIIIVSGNWWPFLIALSFPLIVLIGFNFPSFSRGIIWLYDQTKFKLGIPS